MAFVVRGVLYAIAKAPCTDRAVPARSPSQETDLFLRLHADIASQTEIRHGVLFSWVIVVSRVYSGCEAIVVVRRMMLTEVLGVGSVDKVEKYLVVDEKYLDPKKKQRI